MSNLSLRIAVALGFILSSQILLSAQDVVIGDSIAGVGVKWFWDHSKHAMRFGELDSFAFDYWDEPNIGELSFAWGKNNRATTFRSTAWGRNNLADGQESTAWGSDNVANGLRATAWGNNNAAGNSSSTAWGLRTLANGVRSTAWGQFTSATNDNTTAFGFATIAIGKNATSWGSEAIASGEASTAWGDSAVAQGRSSTSWGNHSVASATAATSWGIETEASGFNATTWGRNNRSLAAQTTTFGSANTAAGNESTAWGSNSTSNGYASTSWGVRSTSNGNLSTAWGESNIASSFAETVFGHYALEYNPVSAIGISEADRLLVVGNGLNVGNRSKALTLYKGGQLSINTVAKRGLLTIRAEDDSTFGPNIFMYGESSDQVESGRLRFVEGTAETNWRGMYIHYDGSANLFHIGRHDPNSNVTSDDENAISIRRTGNPRVGIFRTPDTHPLEVEGQASKTTAGSWVANSDSRLKKNISNLNSEKILRKVLSMQGVAFEWADNVTGYKRPEGVQTGFIAQDIQEIWPEKISMDSKGYLMTAYGDYDPMFVEAFKAQQEMITALQSENEKYKTELELIKKEMNQISVQLSNGVSLLGKD